MDIPDSTMEFEKNMKIVLTFLACITLLSCKTDPNDLTQSDLEGFNDIQIQYLSGKGTTTIHKLSILRADEEIKIIKRRPFYYYGSQTDSTWEKAIDRSELQLIEEFLNIARSHKDTCMFRSSWKERYDIEIGDEERINLVGNCLWKGSDYKALEKKLFKDHFLELDRKRIITGDSVIASLIGSWKVHGLQNGYRQGTKVELIRTEKEKSLDGNQKIWSFGDYFRESAKKEMEVHRGSTTIDLYGSIYRVLQIKSDTIKLEYLGS